MRFKKKKLWLSGVAGFAAGLCVTTSPYAADSAEADAGGAPDLKRIERTMLQLQKTLAEQSKKLAAQERALAQQAEVIETQKHELSSLRDKVVAEPEMRRMRAAGGPGTGAGGTQQAQGAAPDMQSGPGKPPASAAPSAPKQPPKMAAIADVGGVLTRAGRLMIEPTLQYSSSTVNQFSFLGVEVVPSFFIGLTEAQTVDRSIISPSVTARYGITSRLEGEIKVPYVYREDEVSTNVNIGSITGQPTGLNTHTTGSDIGDIEAALHYQINSGANGWPFFIGNVRYKSNTGKGPFDVAFSNLGRPAESPTGSGFNSVEPSITALFPTDPAVLFANVGYLVNIGQNVNKNLTAPPTATNTSSSLHIGQVDPGNAFRLSFGAGFSMNDKTSLTLGVKHDWVDTTTTQVNDVNITSRKVKIGSLLVGGSYQFTPNVYANLNAELGITSDAPDFVMTMRVPFEAFQF